jgi:hypothetical protein
MTRLLGKTIHLCRSYIGLDQRVLIYLGAYEIDGLANVFRNFMTGPQIAEADQE